MVWFKSKLRFEKECDDDGWCWEMPKIPEERLRELGTWDLADWTWGTCAPIMALWADPCFSSRYFNPLTKAVWRLENWLRKWVWVLYFEDRKVLHWIVSKIRNAVFRLGWKLADYDLKHYTPPQECVERIRRSVEEYLKRIDNPKR